MAVNKCFLLITALLVISSCTTEVTKEELCVARLKGRIVSNSPVCAGVAVQILEGYFPPDRVDASWRDSLDYNSLSYQNVFTTYPYCQTSSEQASKFEEIIEEGAVFYFIFKNDESNQFDLSDCAMCKPLVSLPKTVNQIVLVSESCRDVHVIE